MCFELCQAHGDVAMDRPGTGSKNDAGPLGGAVKRPNRARFTNTTRKVTPGALEPEVGREGVLLERGLEDLECGLKKHLRRRSAGRGVAAEGPV